MKKHKILILLLLFIISSIISIVFTNRYKINNQMLIWIDRNLDYERSLDVGDKFNKIAWGDLTFQINHYKSGNKLEYVKNNEKISLLDSIINYKILDGKLYVIASDGCAVVDSDNTAKIYSCNESISLDNVNYITYFEEFEKDEQEVLKKLRPFGDIHF